MSGLQKRIYRGFCKGRTQPVEGNLSFNVGGEQFCNGDTKIDRVFDSVGQNHSMGSTGRFRKLKRAREREFFHVYAVL